MKEAEDSLYSSYIANCVLNVFSSYTAIMLNILTIHAMRKTSSLPKTLKTLLLSLAVSDLAVGVLVQPLNIAKLTMSLQSLQGNTVDIATRTATTIIAKIFVTASFFGIVAISVDRFLAIHLHLRYQELVTHKRVVAVVISIWVFSAFLSLILCWTPSNIASAVIFMIILGLCFISTTIIYFKIYLVVRRHTNQIQALQVQQVAQNGEMANVARQRKSAVTTFYVYLVFIVCYFPFFCTFVSLKISGPSTTVIGLLRYSQTLVFLNSSLNPVIYCWKMRHIRHAIMNILRNISVYKSKLNMHAAVNSDKAN